METIVARRGLVQERERFRAVLDEATDAIRIVDADTHAILDCNRADCELSGLSRDQMLGRDSRPFWPSPASAVAVEGAGGDRKAGVPRTQVGLFETPAGRVLSVDCARRTVEYRHHRSRSSSSAMRPSGWPARTPGAKPPRCAR